jgi:uncharacterized FlaG/YvyC family protein
MSISSSNPIGPATPPSLPSVPPEEAAQRQKLVQAAKSVNRSGVLGQDQIVFSVDRATHRLVIRLEDRDTHEVLLQLPPDYVLRLAQTLGTGSSHTIESDTDT